MNEKMVKSQTDAIMEAGSDKILLLFFHNSKRASRFMGFVNSELNI